ncbi:MAG TPA: hypothetical protein VL961_02975, partial [Acidimicrobiales bacterium]|nr:hypothetical protein [Acidimicrobiales bacterium]
MTSVALHPLSPLQGDEILAARKVVLQSGRTAAAADDVRFAYMGLCDPPKEQVHAYDRGEAVDIDRMVRMVLLQGPQADVTEVVVSVTRNEVVSWNEVGDVRPALQMEEAIHVLAALHEHPDWIAALERRGITDLSLV